ncbi:hypothetical protein [Sulfuricurvum sp.]|uniref:hypothetical protein n=1 Tax=Sulfuricurvum sp. TaxID=2025608 RepID=UPI002602FC46|nr:hypothetical protein [Sulfuricurvum sp.]MDD4950701.1 hypothetical protein [Sulfuricurvum sp.]
MTIRFATIEDISDILDLGEKMVEESRFRSFGLNREKMGKVLESMISETTQSVIIVAVIDNKIIGGLGGYAIDFFFCDVKIAQDRFFYIRSESRGSPAAIKILLAFRKWAEQHNAHELNINMSVAIEIERFNQMMGKLGFQCCGSNFSLPLKS